MRMPQKPPIYFCNGKYVPADQTRISVHDLGLLRGFGLFESLRTYDRKPFLLKPHLERLFRGIRVISLKVPFSQETVSRIIDRLIKMNDFENALIRIILTGGPTSSLLPQEKPTMIVMVDPFHQFPAWQYEKGIALMTTHFFRIHPEIKTTVYFSAVMETVRAVRSGFHEAVYVDHRGAILEGTTFNVFAVLPGPRLVTTEKGVLPGVTAACVIKLAKRLKIPVQRNPISSTMLRRADELFITSSNRELIPVIRVDKKRIGNGKPGVITRQLHRTYRIWTFKEFH